MLSNPLMPLHEQHGAEFQQYADTPVVLTFGEPQAEYAAIRKSAAIMDMPQRGLLELSGKDRLSFLNNLITNQTWDKQTRTPLAPGTGVYGFFLNNKGRIVTDMTVLELGDRTLLEMDARLVEPTRHAFEKYHFSEQVTITSRVGSLHVLFLTGTGVLAALNRSVEPPVPDPRPLESAVVRLLGHQIIVYRDDLCAVPGYGLIVPVEAAAAVWNHFTASPPASGPVPGARPANAGTDLVFRGLARPVGWAAFNATRIEGGRPIFGIDFDESIVPAETGQLGRAVSFTKGCYLGQEIVARMHSRGQVAKQLVGITMESDALPIAGTKVYDQNDNEIGGITSSTVSPVLSNTAVCLGYVKRPFFSPGTRVIIPAEGSMHAGTVTELPFVKP